MPALSLAGSRRSLRQTQNLNLNQTPPESSSSLGAENADLREIRDAHQLTWVRPHVDGPQTFTTVSFVDVLEGRVDPSVFSGKHRVRGHARRAGVRRRLLDASLPATTGKMSGVEIHVNAAATWCGPRSSPRRPAQSRHGTDHAAGRCVAGLAPARLGRRSSGLLVLVSAIAVVYVFVASQFFDRGPILRIWYIRSLRWRFPRRYGDLLRDLRAAPGALPAGGDGALPVAGGDGGDRSRARSCCGWAARSATMTVLFSDIRGFTTFSEQLDPQDLVALLNEYLTGHDGRGLSGTTACSTSTWATRSWPSGTLRGQPDHARRGLPDRAGHARRAARAARALARRAACRRWTSASA